MSRPAQRPGTYDSAPVDPALPLDEAGKYVAGAYLVFVALLLIYVSIMAVRLQRIERVLAELAGRDDNEGRATAPPGDSDE